MENFSMDFCEVIYENIEEKNIHFDGLVVKVLDFQSWGPVFKTTGWLQG